MTDYWFDANFFIPSQSSPDYESTFKQIISIIGTQRSKYTLRITNLISKEIHGFESLIHALFKVTHVPKDQDFQDFCKKMNRFISPSKRLEEQADASLIKAALQLEKKCIIVSSDEGFMRVKHHHRELMKNIKVIEPTAFLKHVLLYTEDENFRKKIKQLILHYAEYFIKYLMGYNRPIERILESLLILDIQAPITQELLPELQDYNTLTEEDEKIIKNFLEDKTLTSSEQKRILPIKEIFAPLKQFYMSLGEENHKIITRTLYVSLSDLLYDVRQLSEREGEISQYKFALEYFLKAEVFNIHIQETIHFFKDCNLDEAFYHFRSLIESDWSLMLSEEMIGVLKFLYGVFLLNVRDFEFFNYLFKGSFWKSYSHINLIFHILSEIKEGKLADLSNLTDSDLFFIYNIGQYYCNTRNELGHLIFNVIFSLEEQKLKNLAWHEEFLYRYVRDLRVNQIDISDKIQNKILNFLPEKSLENNTNIKFDTTLSIQDFLPIENANALYQQPFYMVHMEESENIYEVLCWNEPIKSFVLLEIPRELNINLKNANSLKIKSGNIKTKNVPIRKKKVARIVILLDKACKLDFEQFHIEIKNVY